MDWPVFYDSKVVQSDGVVSNCLPKNNSTGLRDAQDVLNSDLDQKDASYIYGDDYYSDSKDSIFPNNYNSYTTDSRYTTTLIQQIVDVQ